MDRMFGVYICMPGCLYVLLAAANELTRLTAALLSLSWVTVSVDNWGGYTQSLFICIQQTLHTLPLDVCLPSHQQQYQINLEHETKEATTGLDWIPTPRYKKQRAVSGLYADQLSA